jgi:hypothetical protein
VFLSRLLKENSRAGKNTWQMNSKIILQKVSSISMKLNQKFSKTSDLKRWEDFNFEMPWTCLSTPNMMTIAMMIFWKITQSCLFYGTSYPKWHIYWDKFNWLNITSWEQVSAIEDTISPTSHLLNIEDDLKVLRHQTWVMRSALILKY